MSAKPVIKQCLRAPPQTEPWLPVFLYKQRFKNPKPEHSSPCKHTLFPKWGPMRAEGAQHQVWDHWNVNISNIINVKIEEWDRKMKECLIQSFTLFSHLLNTYKSPWIQTLPWEVWKVSIIVHNLQTASHKKQCSHYLWVKIKYWLTCWGDLSETLVNTVLL